MNIIGGFGGEFSAAPAHGNLPFPASGCDFSGGYIHGGKQIGEAVGGSFHQHNSGVWRYRVCPLDVKGSFLPPATVDFGLGTRSKDFPDARSHIAVGVAVRHGTQSKLVGEHT